MKKLAFVIGLTSVFAVGSVAAIPADGTHANAGNSLITRSSTSPTRGTTDRLKALNMQVSPDDAVLDDWLCDGMGPCIELSPRDLD
ncbi:MAG: hypothetical protein ABJB39_04865 [Chloroflexota bacterium]